MMIADAYEEIYERLVDLRPKHEAETRLEYWIRMRHRYPEDAAESAAKSGRASLTSCRPEATMHRAPSA
jgi:hypothetical protein